MRLFSETVLDHYRRPRNYRRLPDADLAEEVDNAVCGDRIRLELRLRGDGIADAAFRGDGCALSVAAASLLTELLAGQTIARAAAVRDEELLAALDASVPPDRLQCALLPLRALRQAMATLGGNSRPA